MQSKEPIISINALEVQQQKGGTDCGLFAIAFIEYIARTKKNPANVLFDQSKMRNHALKCLKNDTIEPFPLTTKTTKIKICKRKEFQLEIYCICRMVWTPSDNNKYDK